VVPRSMPTAFAISGLLDLSGDAGGYVVSE
jgi:hypothetical protein